MLLSISRTSTGNNFYFCSICNITFILLKVKVWNIISYFFHIRLFQTGFRVFSRLLFTGNIPRGVFCEQSSQKTRELRRKIMRMHDFCASRSELLVTEWTVTFQVIFHLLKMRFLWYNNDTLLFSGDLKWKRNN